MAVFLKRLLTNLDHIHDLSHLMEQAGTGVNVAAGVSVYISVPYYENAIRLQGRFVRWDDIV